MAATSPTQAPPPNGDDEITASPSASVLSSTAPSAASAASPKSNTTAKSEKSAAQVDMSSCDPVEQELRELLNKMDGTYKNFSESVFKKMDQMREKIAVLDETTVDLVRGLDDAQSPSAETLRSGRVRKRRA